MTDESESMDGHMEGEMMLIEDLDYFYRFSQLYSLCNYILTMEHYEENISVAEKEKMLDIFIEKNINWIEDTEFLDMNVPMVEVHEVMKPMIKHDLVRDLHYIDTKDLTVGIQQVTMKIVYRIMNELVDEGEMTMAWSAEKNDFVFIPVVHKENNKKRKNKKK